MKTTQSHHKKLNDKIFLEERYNLSTVLDFLIQKIQHLVSNKPYPDVHPYSVGYDYDDRQDLMYKKQCNYETEQEIQSLSEFQESPYFARMDFSILREQTEYEKIYIGKKGLNIDGQQLVYDWRSPVGQRYYIKSATEFDHNEYKFTLLLRRALSITKGQLASYNDEYVYGDEIFKEGITDPFLVNALREKKNEHRLTDIIKTIQENQNNIIRFSARKSFILQGCAGSGKTMIMLHRLSHMIFNNPQSDFSKIKIITPNDNFNIHINDLYTELGLNKIERYKVDDYYVYLLKQYAPERWKKQPMIMSDSALDEQFINSIYSEDFYSSCASKYSSYVKHIYDVLSIDTVNQICSIHDLSEVYTSSKSDYDSINRYRDFIRRILEINERNISELKNTLKKIHETQMKIDSQENDTSLRTMIEIYEKDKLRLYNQIKELDNMSSECRHKCKAVCDRYGFDFLVGEGLELLSSYEKILNLNAARTDIVLSWSQKLSVAEAKRQALLETYKPIINWQITQKENDQFELRQSQQEIARIPFWRFVAKQQLQVKIQELEKKLKQNQGFYLEACETIKEADISIDKLKTALKEFENKIASTTDYNTIKNCLNIEKDG